MGLEKMPGVEMPYSKKFLVETKCMSWASTEDKAQGSQDYPCWI